MTFVHRDPEFPQLVQIVARSTGISAALIEKDYWVTHTLWAIHQTGLDIWFKGGTSLSKGFGLIQRFSEDLDLMVERGSVGTLPEVTSWTSTNRGPLAARRAFYDALAPALLVPDVTVERDVTRVDKQARGADYLAPNQRHVPGPVCASRSVPGLRRTVRQLRLLVRRPALPVRAPASSMRTQVQQQGDRDDGPLECRDSAWRDEDVGAGCPRQQHEADQWPCPLGSREAPDRGGPAAEGSVDTRGIYEPPQEKRNPRQPTEKQSSKTATH